MSRTPLVLLLLVTGLLAQACTSDSTSPTAMATATSTSTAVDTGGATDSTGLAGIDALIEDVAAGDSARLTARFALQEVECTDQPGPGLPPPCRAAGPPGTLVSVFPVAACEAGWASEVEPLVEHLLAAAPTLHSVARVGDQYQVVWVAPFARDPGQVEVLRLTIEGDSVVAFDEGCGPIPAATDVTYPDGAEVILTGAGASG